MGLVVGLGVVGPWHTYCAHPEVAAKFTVAHATPSVNFAPEVSDAAHWELVAHIPLLHKHPPLDP